MKVDTNIKKQVIAEIASEEGFVPVCYNEYTKMAGNSRTAPMKI